MKSLTLTRYITSIIILLFLVESSMAQVSCTQVLNNATSQYQEGSLVFIKNRDFNDCFTRADGYTDAERIQARELVVLAHIYEDRISDAEEAMIQLLHDDPEHPIDEALDPYEFVYLYNKFRTKPIFRVGFRAGVTYSTMNLIDEFGVEDLNDRLGSEFTPEIGIAFGAYVDYNFWRNFEASLGVNFSTKAVSFSNDLYPSFDEDSIYSITTYSDTYSFIDVPLVIKYNFNISPRFIVFPYGGVIGNYLLGANRTGSREVVTPPSVDLGNVRQTLNYTYTAGVGLKLRSNTDYFTLEFGVNKGGNNFVDPDGRYQNSDLVFRLGQVDGNMGLDHLSVMFGYQRSIYKPTKLKQFREE